MVHVHADINYMINIALYLKAYIYISIYISIAISDAAMLFLKTTCHYNVRFYCSPFDTLMYHIKFCLPDLFLGLAKLRTFVASRVKYRTATHTHTHKCTICNTRITFSINQRIQYTILHTVPHCGHPPFRPSHRQCTYLGAYAHTEPQHLLNHGFNSYIHFIHQSRDPREHIQFEQLNIITT